MNEQNNQNNVGAEESVGKGNRPLHIFITVFLIVTIVVLILLLVYKCSSEPPTLNPDYPPQENDENLIPLPDNGNERLPHEEGGGAVILDLSDEMTIKLSDESTVLDFANPAGTSSNMVLWVTIQDKVIAQSGLIPPGYGIETINLNEDAVKLLSEGIYNGKFIIHFYDPESNECALVNSEVKVTITVTK